MTELALSLDHPPQSLGLPVRAGLAALVLAAHAGLAWTVLSLPLKPAETPPPKVLQVTWLTATQPEEAPPQPPQAQAAPSKLAEPAQPIQRTPQRPAATPELAPPTPVPSPVPVPTAVAQPAPAATQQPLAAAAANAGKADSASTNESAAATAPAAPKVIASSALRYIDPPKPVYPRLSTELCETGTVTLNILVNEWGVPTEVSVDKTSGHERLDQAAVAAMRAARFKPYTEAGQARPIRAYPPIKFQLDC
jgi:protein TonB